MILVSRLRVLALETCCALASVIKCYRLLAERSELTLFMEDLGLIFHSLVPGGLSHSC